MTMILPRVRIALPEDMEPVCDTLAHAFATGDAASAPLAHWVQPNPDARLELYQAFARSLYPKALREAEVWITDDYMGVAVWYRIGLDPRPVDYDAADLADLDELAGQAMAEMAGPHHDHAVLRLTQLDHEVMRRQRQRPHHYLAFMGVRPDVQGYGIGSALLEHHHAGSDRAGEPSWLVATSQESAKLYRRHRYALLDAFYVGSDSPQVYSMWREPARP